MEHRASIVVILVLCVAWQAHAAVNCTTAGRFPDPSDTTCQNYTLCVYITSNTSFISYNYVCPTTSVFNPNIAKCTSSSNYTCNVTNTTNTTNTTSVCTADGYVADPNASNCSSYIECVELTNGTYSEETIDCPSTTFYNPNTTLCESDYNCTTTEETPEAFNCTSAGRFADSTSTNCQSYYFCVLVSNGTFIQYNYTCPTTSVFNPATGLCTTRYTCPT